MQLATRATCNTCNLQHMQFATHAICTHTICNSCNFEHIRFSTLVICNMCNLQHVQFATRASCNTCNLQHLQFATSAIWRILPSPLWKWRGPYLVSRVVPHLRGERGWVSCHSSGSLEGGCPSSAEVIEDTEDFIQFDGLYSPFSAVERFLYLRDFFW